MQRTWWKEAVIYQIYPRSFKDSNGDGVGDLRGIIEQLDYLQQLGVDVLWLSPIYDSPNDDNGYDIRDYRAIMTEFGTMLDFEELLEGIHRRGMKLLMDLVVNHTSDEHLWFQQSRQSPDNPYRDYYIWREQPNNWLAFFRGSAWEWDATSGAYYLHLFTRKQPDLNWENPLVRQEVYALMRFWLDKGVDGFRMDVIPLISKHQDFPDGDFTDFNAVVENLYANGPRVHEFLQEMNREVLRHYDIMTVGEGIGIRPAGANAYVGAQRQELQMIFHFGHMFIDHGPGGKFDVIPVDLPRFKKIFTDWHEALGTEGWVNIYLDNHDFPRLVSRFGNDQHYRVQSAKMLALLLLSLRGTPCIYQGSEIGMTNVAFPSWEDYRDVEIRNLYHEYLEKGMDLQSIWPQVQQQARDNARTPFQWDDQPQAGFTTGEPWIGVNPNYPQINAAQALRDPESIFFFYQKMLKLRKAHPTLVYGEYLPLVPEHPTLYAYHRWDAQGAYLITLNFSDVGMSEWPFPWPSNAMLLISNYPAAPTGSPLRPWEGRLYRLIGNS